MHPFCNKDTFCLEVCYHASRRDLFVRVLPLQQEAGEAADHHHNKGLIYKMKNIVCIPLLHGQCEAWEVCDDKQKWMV